MTLDHLRTLVSSTFTYIYSYTLIRTAVQNKKEILYHILDFMVGNCKWFNVAKGWGFITPSDGSQDVFVHQVRISRLKVEIIIIYNAT